MSVTKPARSERLS